MVNRFEVTEEELEVFISEAEEQIQILETQLVRLEDGNIDSDLLSSIFRAAHTLKGSSATLGHQRMAGLTHCLENVLDAIRNGHLDPKGDVLDVLFASLDLLRALKDEIASGRAVSCNEEEVITRLEALLGDGVRPRQQQEARAGGETVTPRSRAKTTSGPSGDGSDLEDLPVPAFVREGLFSGVARGWTPMRVEARLDPETVMPAVRMLQVLMELENEGEVLYSRPSQEEIDLEQVGDRVEVYCTARSPAEAVRAALLAVTDVAEVTVTPLVLAGSTSGSTKGIGKDRVAFETPEAISVEGAMGSAGDPDDLEVGGEYGGEEAGRGSLGKDGPRRTVRVDVAVLDNLLNLVGELVIDRTRLGELVGRLVLNGRNDETTQELGRTFAHIGRVTGQLQEEIMKARMLPVDGLFKKFPRMMRDLRRRSGKKFQFTIKGEDTELDRSVIEAIGDPLIHLLRNSVDHGVEPPAERARAGKNPEGNIVLLAFREENEIVIRVEDDGRGIDPVGVGESAARKGLISAEEARRMTESEALELIFAPGFSTREKATELSGRGVGLDVVRKNIESLGGRVSIDSALNRGTRFDLRIPLTLATVQALLVNIAGIIFALPLGSIVETLKIAPSALQSIGGQEVTVVRGKVVPLLRPEVVFGLERQEAGGSLYTVLVAVDGEQVGLVVDSLVGEQEVVVKNLGTYVGDVTGLAGATVLGDGSLALILDVPSLIRNFMAARGSTGRRRAWSISAEKTG